MDDLTVLIAKSVGSFFGTLLALVYQQPKTKAEFVTRSVFSIISGVLFAPPMREFLKWGETVEMWVAAAALVAAVSWWAMAMIVKVIGSFKLK